MKVKVPILVQDQWAAQREGIDLIEKYFIEDEDFFLDGPVTKRIAIVDFDPDSGMLVAGAHFKSPEGRRKTGEYEIVDDKNLSALDLHQVLVFSAVKKAMEMFEEPDTLGRPLVWAFNAPQLLVVPRAGRWENAYYERDSHSLQFFFFEHPNRPGETVYTSLSRDIVSHETGHAILDGIAPHLYNAIAPQSLALHEGVADLVAVLIAFRSPKLRQAVLDRTGGSIESSTEFSAVAEEFGNALDGTGLAGYLRNLYNQKTLDLQDTSVDKLGNPNRVVRIEPHILCEVLTGALYSVMVKLHSALRTDLATRENKSEFSVSGKALALGSDRFKRMILRSLDYLPPGEVSFADYGRAIIASDTASHPAPEDDQVREWLRQEFIRRKIVPNRQALEVKTNLIHPAFEGIDLQNLLESNWAAYQFANQHRELFGIPADVPFEVEPRLKVTKRYYHRDGPKDVSECLFKVWWYTIEDNQVGMQFPPNRRISVGTTLAIDWETNQIRVRLSSDRANSPGEEKEQREDRDQFLRALAEQGILRTKQSAVGPDGKPLCLVISADDLDGVMRVNGMARMLHVIGRS